MSASFLGANPPLIDVPQIGPTYSPRMDVFLDLSYIGALLVGVAAVVAALTKRADDDDD